jgi:hypothetical protein
MLIALKQVPKKPDSMGSKCNLAQKLYHSWRLGGLPAQLEPLLEHRLVLKADAAHGKAPMIGCSQISTQYRTVLSANTRA